MLLAFSERLNHLSSIQRFSLGGEAGMLVIFDDQKNYTAVSKME